MPARLVSLLAVVPIVPASGGRSAQVEAFVEKGCSLATRVFVCSFLHYGELRNPADADLALAPARSCNVRIRRLTCHIAGDSI
jgi:hypothetical protein